MPYKLSNDLKLTILGNYEKLEKPQMIIELLPSAQSSSQIVDFVSKCKNLLKILN